MQTSLCGPNSGYVIRPGSAYFKKGGNWGVVVGEPRPARPSKLDLLSFSAQSASPESPSHRVRGALGARDSERVKLAPWRRETPLAPGRERFSLRYSSTILSGDAARRSGGCSRCSSRRYSCLLTTAPLVRAEATRRSVLFSHYASRNPGNKVLYIHIFISIGYINENCANTRKKGRGCCGAAVARIEHRPGASRAAFALYSMHL